MITVLRVLYAVAAVINFASFVAELGFVLGEWRDPQLSANLIWPAFAVAAIVRLDAAIKSRSARP